MNIGDLVYNSYYSILRFGTIQSKRIDQSGWAYFKVKWYADETYEAAMNLRQKLTHKDYSLQEYRADQITPISKDFLSKVLEGSVK